MAIFCENCGKQLDDNARFCADCGYATGVQQTAPAPPPPPVQPVYQAQTGLQGKGGGKKPASSGIVAVAAIAVLVVALIVVCVIFIPKILGGGLPPTANPAPAGPVVPAPQDGVTTVKTTYTGDEMPTIGDFFWFTESDSFPADRTVITDFNEITGFWKAYEVSKPFSPEEGRFLKFFNAEIGGDAGQLTFTYRMANSGGFDEETGNTVDISKQDGEIYKGSFDNGALTAGDITTKGVQILIGEFYYYDGRQYAYGIEMYIDGDTMYIALVRP